MTDLIPPPYRIERTKNRSSRATFRDGTILIRLAERLTEREEQKHIEILLKRMSKAALKEVSRTKINPFKELLSGANSTVVELCTGTRIVFEMMTGRKTKAKRTDEGWDIARSPTLTDAAFHRLLWKLLAESIGIDVESLVHQINQKTFGLRVRSVKTKFMRSRWGSCSNTGIVTLSTPLFCTTPEIMEYVIIHELAHILHMNHSRKFWAEVRRFCPDYQHGRKELRMYTLSHMGRGKMQES